MTNKTTILIAALFLITCVLSYFAITTTPSVKKSPVSPTPTPIGVHAQTTLSLVTASATESSRVASHTVAVVIDSTNQVNAVQLELSYDPSRITRVTLTPGTYFAQPNVLLKSIDPSTGRISYALGEQVDIPGKSGKGTVALISFDLVPGAQGGATTIKFLPKTAVTADKIMESVLKSTNDIAIPLPVVASQSATPQGTSSAK